MGSDWNLELPKFKEKKRGIAELRPVGGSRKKIAKWWVVFWQPVRKFILFDRGPYSRKFATEEQAKRWIEQEQRRYSCHPSTDRPWSHDRYWIEHIDCVAQKPGAATPGAIADTPATAAKVGTSDAAHPAPTLVR